MLMPNAAFCTGLQTIAKFEAARVGVQWGDVFMEVSWHKLPRFEMLQLCNVKLQAFRNFALDRLVTSSLSSPNSLVLGAQSWWVGKWDPQSISPTVQGEKLLLHICSGHDVPRYCSALCLQTVRKKHRCSFCAPHPHDIHTTSTWQKRGSSSCWAQVYGAGLVLWSRAAQRVWRAPVSQLHISTIILAVHLEALQCETCTVYVNPFSFLSRWI